MKAEELIKTDKAMNRVIKFRGKLIKNNEWVCGDLVRDTKGNMYVYPEDAEGLYITNRVHPETVGQFTGLLDIHGKEIYEGDIIRTYGTKGDEIKHTVEYSEKEAMFCTKLIGAYMLGGSITQRWIYEFEFELIGNIHDNPELLKEARCEKEEFYRSQASTLSSDGGRS